MTRDGVLMIEDGEITYAVKNLRFTQSYVQALAGTQALGRDLKTLIDEGGSSVCVPAIKIERFTFTGMTV
jgi:predicted Zn-dependent protease